MITVFLCDKEGCANCGVTYYFEGQVKKAECGGCGRTLKAVEYLEALPGEPDAVA